MPNLSPEFLPPDLSSAEPVLSHMALIVTGPVLDGLSPAERAALADEVTQFVRQRLGSRAVQATAAEALLPLYSDPGYDELAQAIGDGVNAIRGPESQKQFAERLETTQGAVSDIERGSKIPKIPTIQRITHVGGWALGIYIAPPTHRTPPNDQI
jgi:hypothetical protein